MSPANVAAAFGEEIVPFDVREAHKSVFRALIEARSRFGGTRAILVDGDEHMLSYDDIIRAALALGHALKKGTNPGEAVAIMLPTGAGAIIAFFAVSAYGRIPTMLNFTSGAANLKSALRTARVKRVVTAHRFVEAGKFEGLIAALKDTAEIVYLEDVRAKLSLTDKAAAAIGQYAPWLVTAHPGHHAAAVILFTSGTEGMPKGVALSHLNLLSNVQQVRSHIALYPSDVLFNPLPTFHCFGLTVGVLMPLLLGIKVVFHPTPLQPREIAASHPLERRHDPADDRHLHFAICARRRARRSQLAAPCGMRRGAVARRNPRVAAQEIQHRIAGRLWRHRNRAGRCGQSAGRQSLRHGRPADAGHGNAARTGRRHPRMRAVCSCVVPMSCWATSSRKSPV